MRKFTCVIATTTFVFLFTNVVAAHDVVTYVGRAVTLELLDSKTTEEIFILIPTVLGLFKHLFTASRFLWLGILLNCGHSIFLYLCFHETYKQTVKEIVVGSSRANTDRVPDEMGLQPTSSGEHPGQTDA